MQNDTSQTNSQVAQFRKNQSVSWGFQRTRQQVQMAVLSKNQILLSQKYVLYELLVSEKNYDLYQALALKNRTKVTIKIIDKSLLKESINKKQGFKMQSQQYDEIFKKIKVEDQIQTKIYDLITSIFMIRCHEIIENQDFHIKICENYYHQSLQTVLKRRNSLPLCEALAILKQAIISLSEIHRQGLILTELDPQFIIQRNGVYKISDLSSMRRVNQKFISKKRIHSNCSFRDYVAPQLQICPQVIDMKSEVWALGILLYYLIAHNISYEERGNDIVKQAKSHHIMFETKTGQASQEVLSFIRQLLVIDPEQRISWKKLVNHPIFQNQQHFSAVKISPIVDARDSSLKKRQNQVIPEQIMNICESVKIDKNYQQKWTHVETIDLFKSMELQHRIMPQKYIDIDNETYFHIKMINLMILKAEYIYNQIIQKILKFNLVDEKRKSHLQTVFFMIQKCHIYLSRAKSFRNRSSDRRLENYLEQLKHLTLKVKQTFENYRQKLKKVRKSTYYISNDIFTSVVKKAKTKQRKVFSRGKQGVDFQPAQKLEFIQEVCINKIMPEMKGESAIMEYVKLNMKHFQQINQIAIQQLQKSYSFSQVCSQVINKSLKLQSKK